MRKYFKSADKENLTIVTEENSSELLSASINRTKQKSRSEEKQSSEELEEEAMDIDQLINVDSKPNNSRIENEMNKSLILERAVAMGGEEHPTVQDMIMNEC